MADGQIPQLKRLPPEQLAQLAAQSDVISRFNPAEPQDFNSVIGDGYYVSLEQPGQYYGEGEFRQTDPTRIAAIFKDIPGTYYSEVYSPQGEYLRTAYTPPSNDFAIIASMLAAPFLAEFILPAISSALPAGTSAATASAVANAAAKAGIAIATGADPGKALVGAVASVGLSGVNLGGALDNIITDPQISDAVASAARSMASTAAGGGTTDDIVRAGLSGAAGSTLASQTGNIYVGRLVGQVLAGESPAQIIGSTLGGAAQTAIKDIKGDTKPSNIPRSVAGAPVTPTAPSGPAVEPIIPEQEIVAQTEVQPSYGPSELTPQQAIQASILMDNLTKTYTVPVEQLENFKKWADLYILDGGDPTNIKAFDQYVAGGATPAAGTGQAALEPREVTGTAPTDIEVGGVTPERTRGMTPTGAPTGAPTATLPPKEVRGKRGEEEADVTLDPVTVRERKIVDVELEPKEIIGERELVEVESPTTATTEPTKPKEPIDRSVISVTTPAKPPKPSRPAGGEPAPTEARGGSPLQQALTAFVPAGDVEVGTGKPRQNVWNEASLRLKDALGL